MPDSSIYPCSSLEDCYGLVLSCPAQGGGICRTPITAWRTQSVGHLCLSLSRGQPLPFEWVGAGDGAQLWAPGPLPLGPRQWGDQGYPAAHAHAAFSAAPLPRVTAVFR